MPKIKNRTPKGFSPDSSGERLKLKKRPRGKAFSKNHTVGAEFRFKPGQSGNYSGRPKCKSFLDAIARALESDTLPVPRTVVEKLVHRWIREGLAGNWNATAELANRKEGKATNTMVVNEGTVLLRDAITMFNAKHQLNQLENGDDDGDELLLEAGEPNEEEAAL